MQNLEISGRCTGVITISIPAGIPVVAGNFLRIEGVRGRVDLSDGIVVNTDLYAQMSSINDPAANQFTPDIVRVAKSLPGLVVDVTDSSVSLCFPPFGTVLGSPPEYRIRIREGYVRSFVNYDPSNIPWSRLDSSGALLGSPTNATRLKVVLNSIPASIASISWPLPSVGPGTSYLAYVSSTPISGGMASAVYEFVSSNQTEYSDITLESFDLAPVLNISPTNQTSVGAVLAAVSLYPAAETAAACDRSLVRAYRQLSRQLHQHTMGSPERHPGSGGLRCRRQMRYRRCASRQ